MQRPPKKRKKRESLGETLLNTFFPPRYAPPSNRVPSQLVGWSGIPTDQPPADPYAWGQNRRF